MSEEKYFERTHIETSNKNKTRLEEAKELLKHFNKHKLDTRYYVVEVRQISPMGGTSYVLTHIKDIDYKYIGFGAILTHWLLEQEINYWELRHKTDE